MAEFEDLIKRAREGDLTALDELETDFSGTSLRQKAEQASEWQNKYQSSVPLIRKARVDEIVGKLDESLRSAGLSPDDFADVDPGDLTEELVTQKAQARLDEKNAARLAAAKEAGFETVEEYNAALDTVKKTQTERKEGMEGVASGTSSSGGEGGDTGPQTKWDAGKQAFDEAKKSGQTDDLARSEAAKAILDFQMVGAEDL